jgi:uncharacterized Zn finger protein (UPF0148 family)
MNPTDHGSSETAETAFSQPERRCGMCGQPGYIQTRDGAMLCASCFVRSHTGSRPEQDRQARQEATN